MSERIGLWAELSHNGVALITEAINKKLSVVICPLRDPKEEISLWLESLGVKKVVYSDDKPDLKSFSLSRSLPSAMGEEFSSIIRTSGTSGKPKSALIKYGAHAASALAVNAYFSLTNKSTWALSVPLYHVSGLSIIFRTMLSKAKIIVATDHQSLKDAIERGVTHLSLVPVQLKRLLDENVPLNKIDAVIIGGDALPEILKNRALDAGIALFETYGLSETASMIWVKDSRQSLGELLPHASMSISLDGEILVGGASLFSGYILDQVLSPSKNPFPTGDVVGEKKIGNLKLISRKSNRIISGGENIQLEEIERIIKCHEAIVDCVVVGRANDYGQSPHAFIKWKDKPLIDELYIYLLKHLASFKIPKSFEPWPSHVPMGVKVNRSAFFK